MRCIYLYPTYLFLNIQIIELPIASACPLAYDSRMPLIECTCWIGWMYIVINISMITAVMILTMRGTSTIKLNTIEPVHIRRSFACFSLHPFSPLMQSCPDNRMCTVGCSCSDISNGSFSKAFSRVRFSTEKEERRRCKTKVIFCVVC